MATKGPSQLAMPASANSPIVLVRDVCLCCVRGLPGAHQPVGMLRLTARVLEEQSPSRYCAPTASSVATSLQATPRARGAGELPITSFHNIPAAVVEFLRRGHVWGTMPIILLSRNCATERVAIGRGSKVLWKVSGRFFWRRDTKPSVLAEPMFVCCCVGQAEVNGATKRWPNAQTPIRRVPAGLPALL